MRYLLLIYGNENPPEGETEAEAEASMQEWFAYTMEMVEAGVMLGGDPLQPTTTATTVRMREGEALTTDGPFAETKEVLGGYYVLDVPDLDAAVQWAAKCPGAKEGSIELRPVMELPADAMPG
jgi:hypothetical protein